MKRFTATPTGPTHMGSYHIAQDGFIGWKVTPQGLAVGSSRTLADWMNDAEERIAELKDELLLREDVITHYEADLAKVRLLLVAIDENLGMDVNPLTYTTRRIVELLRDPASNPWAALMRAGKEGGE